MYHHKNSVDDLLDLSCYEKIKKLGEGGMGEVFLVRHRGSNKLYAMKVLLQSERAIREKDFMEKCRSFYGVAHLKTWGMEEDKICLVMDYIQGISLKDYVRKKRRISSIQVLCWMIQLCTILQQFHENTPEIVYRDLKPDHLILRKDGRLFLIDFGISVWGGEAVMPYGTKGFASPEQFRQGEVASTAMDIYSFGKVLLFCLTKCKKQKNLQNLAKKCVKEKKKERCQTMVFIKKQLKKILFYKLYCMIVAAVFFLSGIWIWQMRMQNCSVTSRKQRIQKQVDLVEQRIKHYEQKLKNPKQIVSYAKLWEELREIKKQAKDKGKLLEEETWKTIYSMEGKQKQTAISEFGQCYLTKCKKAEQSFPGYQRVLLYLESKGEEADEAYEKFIKKFPDYEEAYVDYGIYLCRYKKWEKAKVIYQRGKVYTKMQSHKAKQLKEKLGV